MVNYIIRPHTHPHLHSPRALANPARLECKQVLCSGAAGRQARESSRAEVDIQIQRQDLSPISSTPPSQPNPHRNDVTIEAASVQLTGAAKNHVLCDPEKGVKSQDWSAHPTEQHQQTAHHASGYAPRGRVRPRPVQGEKRHFRMRFTISCLPFVVPPADSREAEPSSNTMTRAIGDLDGRIGWTETARSRQLFGGTGRAGIPLLYLGNKPGMSKKEAGQRWPKDIKQVGPRAKENVRWRRYTERLLDAPIETPYSIQGASG